jgi:cleavage stimulation factor subunit 3
MASSLHSSDDQQPPVQVPRQDSDDDYDPSNLVTPEVALPATTMTENGTNKQQSRTIGGFVIEDDEDEEDSDVQTTGAVLNKPADTVVAHVNKTMQPTDHHLNKSTITHPPSVSDDSRAASSTPLPNFQSPPAMSTSEQQTSPISLPKIHVPKDRIGQLQDRIKDDPRGDMDAYLELIREYRQKNRLDDARATYKQFLDLIPSAVSLSSESYCAQFKLM